MKMPWWKQLYLQSESARHERHGGKKNQEIYSHRKYRDNLLMQKFIKEKGFQTLYTQQTLGVLVIFYIYTSPF